MGRIFENTAIINPGTPTCPYRRKLVTKEYDPDTAL